jgi:hypothetical protein
MGGLQIARFAFQVGLKSPVEWRVGFFRSCPVTATEDGLGSGRMRLRGLQAAHTGMVLDAEFKARTA